MEKSAGAEARTSAGDAGVPADAGEEGSTHDASTGAGPLPERQTTIEWPVVGGKYDGALRIPYRGAGTRRSALGLPAQPPGAAAMAPGTSGPTGRAASEACDCEGATGRRSTRVRSGGPGPGGESGPGGGGGTPRGCPGPDGGT